MTASFLRCDRTADYPGAAGAWSSLDDARVEDPLTAATPPSSGGAARATAPPPDPTQASTGELIGRLGDQLSRLVRDEVRLAQAEVTQKAERLGIGVGLFGGAGVVALLGLGALVTAAVLGPANVMSGWLAAIVVAVVLLAVAGTLALIGKKDVDKATPPLPTEAIAGVRADTDTVKEGISR
jgi:hypothetical protein